MPALPLGQTNRPALRVNPRCVTCHGTGIFVAKGKLRAAAIECPRCRGQATINYLPQRSDLAIKDRLPWEIR